MSCKVDIGIIGALDEEVSALIAKLSDRRVVKLGGVELNIGELYGRSVAIAKSGVGKVFAAMCAEAMIVETNPELLVNTGVGGALRGAFKTTDTAIAEKLVQHDMDTSAIGDPKGLISGINKIYFDADKRAVELLCAGAELLGLTAYRATVASGDKFVASVEDKEKIIEAFGADVCEMEGAAIAQVAFVNQTPFAVIRAISDSADAGATMDYLEFLPIAAKNSSALTEYLIDNY